MGSGFMAEVVPLRPAPDRSSWRPDVHQSRHLCLATNRTSNEFSARAPRHAPHGHFYDHAGLKACYGGL